MNGQSMDSRMHESSHELIIRTQKIQLPETSRFRQDDTSIQTSVQDNPGYNDHMLSYPSPSHDPETMNSDRSCRSDNPFDIADDASEQN